MRERDALRDLIGGSQIAAGDVRDFAVEAQMPIPNAKRAFVAIEKVRDYLLNLEHPDGGAKANWFRSLGYTQEHSQLLSDHLLSIASDCDDFDTETTPFGIKYKAHGMVGCPGHRPGRVLTVWIVEDDDPPRLVTAYPDEDI
ncbi:MAG: hypothetical protein KDA62_08675 [Planctomycetales bacterium]|nr:hypothetical protein [Planctomycetales bacterium]